MVAIGASAGGLEACRLLLAAAPANIGMAFILVLHLDPKHESLAAGLLARGTALDVVEATEGMRLRPGRVHVIPPGAQLSVSKGALRLDKLDGGRGVRLPFDHLLVSLAVEVGPLAGCVVLSGTAADGSAGLAVLKAAGGFVIAQSPEEAGYPGMPESAIATGLVDLVLPAEDVIPALVKRWPDLAAPLAAHDPATAESQAPSEDALAEITALVRTRAPQDVTLYKTGTIRRRVARRMAMIPLAAEATGLYLARLLADPKELDLLAADLLIHVTSFFRDAVAFEALATTTVPAIVAAHGAGLSPQGPIRIWVAGCSTGEEAYSLAMAFTEGIEAAGSEARLQILASDIDPDAVAAARDGFYPDGVASGVSEARLKRFFTREDGGWRVSPDLREMIVFTVHDLLADPPFSRIDLVSCRNVMIYLGAEAQRRLVALFAFALLPGGWLLLGAAETPGPPDGRFDIADKAGRLWRKIGRGAPGELPTMPLARPGAPQPGPPAGGRRALLAETCRRLVLEAHAPAAALLNQRLEALYLLGPTERYLRLAPGHPSLDFLAMAPRAMRVRLRAAAAKCLGEGGTVTVTGGRSAEGASFSVEISRVSVEAEPLLLACFLDLPEHGRGAEPTKPGPEATRVAELEAELEASRAEVRGALRDLETSAEEHVRDAAEALSVNEEYQSTNEELLASKEELQSLNEELTALNGQLQETMERQRTIANDLQNVLYSTDVATLFLDRDLNIRFFTPAARALFHVIATDVGRPLSDLAAQAADAGLEADARAVLGGAAPIVREVGALGGRWFARRMQPYRNDRKEIEGVVITFEEVTEARRAAEALREARRMAERADAAKSRFLAAASHDLRQPLQTLTLVHTLLRKSAGAAEQARLAALLDRTLTSMTAMLDTLLDVNRIETGDIAPEIGPVRLAPLMAGLAEEFGHLAKERGLRMRLVPCSATIRSDPRLLEQILRNLLSNAIKYTRKGGVLLGCRRRGDKVSIEIWDTGIGMEAEHLERIFEAYHQIDDEDRDPGRHGHGLGLGLSIVQRLGSLLDHRISVRSRPGGGSGFAVEAERLEAAPVVAAPAVAAVAGKRGAILLVEDEPDLRDLLTGVLLDAGHEVLVAADAAGALKLIGEEGRRPDLVVTDHNLGGDMTGLELAGAIGSALGAREGAGGGAAPPTIILTGDITAATLGEIGRSPFVRVSKPATAEALTAKIDELLAGARRAKPEPPAAKAETTAEGEVHVVDDDPAVLNAVRELFASSGWAVVAYRSAEDFLAAPRPGRGACLVADVRLPGMDGIAMLRRLRDEGGAIPAVMITGHGETAMAVAAMKAGAADFIEKPIPAEDLIASVARALALAKDAGAGDAWRAEAAERFARLTRREREVMEMVLGGMPNKNIAADLGLSQRTVENHRAAVMRKTGSASLPDLVRLALTAKQGDA